VALIDGWNASSWTQSAVPSSGPVTILKSASASSTSDAWAVGYTTTTTPPTLIAQLFRTPASPGFRSSTFSNIYRYITFLLLGFCRL
jgi:hypothetical protein